MTNDIATPASVQLKKTKPQNIVRFNPATARVPAWLKETPRWCLWKVEPHKATGKPTKAPKQRDGRNASSNRPTEWCSFDEAVEALRVKPALFDGIGFMLGDGYAGFDLDSVLHNGAMSAEASALLGHLAPRANAWLETSPSGIGVKAFFRLKVTDEVEALKGTSFTLPNGQEAELYSGGRYFTLTGSGYEAWNDPSQAEAAQPFEAEVFISLHGELAGIDKAVKARAKDAKNAGNIEPKPTQERSTTQPMLTDEEVVSIARRAKNGAKVARMLAGDASDYAGDASDMHAGLACALYFYCGSVHGGGKAQVERIMQKYLAGTHEKINETRQGIPYLRFTIENCCDEVTKVYEGNGSANERAPQATATRTPGGVSEVDEFMLVDEFAKSNYMKMIYVSEEKTWYLVNDQTLIFRNDRLHTAPMMAKECIEKVVNDSNDPRADRLKKIDLVYRVLKLASARREFAVLKENLDAERWLLGTPGGIYDLKTGHTIKALMGSSVPENFDVMRYPFGTLNIVTRETAETPATIANEKTCPNWLRFINEACGFNKEKVDFLQRYAGYCLTGDYSEHTFVIIYGQPGTGKSLFTGAIQYALGEYATVLPASALMKERTQTAASSDIAKLAGARFALANEFPEGEALDEARIKTLTGGDKITARMNGKDYFEFTQQAKFLATTNHKPRILNPRKGVDRRMLLVEFTESPAKIDIHLQEKLKNEAPGILRWMMDGLKALQANRGENESGGLNPPKCILDATNAYLEEEDELGAWVEDCFTMENGAFTTTEMIMHCYEKWSEENGLSKRLHPRQLTELLQVRGCLKTKQYATRAPREGYTSGEKKQLRGYQGLKMKDSFYGGL